MHEQHQRLVRLINDQAGENFRGAFRYDENDWSVLYVRDDLATPDLQTVVPPLIQRAREHEPIVREADYDGLGVHRASVSVHAEAVLVHIREGTQSGTVVTLDTEVARNISEFVTQCEAILQA